MVSDLSPILLVIIILLLVDLFFALLILFINIIGSVARIISAPLRTSA